MAAALAGVLVTAESPSTALLDIPENLPRSSGGGAQTAVLLPVGTEYVRDLEPRPFLSPGHQAPYPRTDPLGVPRRSKGLWRRWMCRVLTDA